MLIDNLNIQCFRGISDSLSLDFTAPLTVLYAPNGTGKTSICDAVEWVLCGGVGRLGKDESIRCKLGDDSLKTTVEANIPQNGRPFFIKRELSGSGTPLYWKDSDCDYTIATDQELLRRFVKALPPSGNSNKAKVDWVRSTRFLESDSLRLLIDSDKESNDTRKLIFSSLFGVAEYQKNERDLNRILGKLPSERKINSETSKINKKIAEYEELIKKLTAEQTAPYKDHVYNLLSNIAERLGIAKNTDKEADLQKYHETLEVQYIQYIESLVEKKSLLAFIREKIGVYQEYLSSYETINKIIKTDISTQEILIQDFKKKQIEITEKKEFLQKKEELINEIRESISGIKTEKATWLNLYNLYKNHSLEIDASKNRTTEISNYITSTEQRISTLNEKLLLVGDYIKSLPSWRKKHAELKGINIELEALQERKSKEAPDVPLTEQASKIKSELDALQSSREKALGEIELLLSSGKRYVETHTEDSECPLCEHSHESNFVLQEKINTRFSRLSKKSKEEAVLASKLDEITQLLTQENNYLKKAEELTAKKIFLINAIQETSETFIAMGLDRSDISKQESISEKLEDIQLQYQTSVKKLFKDIAPYKSAYDAASKLEEIRIKAQSLSSLWFERLDISGEKSFTTDGTSEALEKLEAALEMKSTELKQLHEDSKSNVQKLSDEILKAEKDNKKKAADIAAAREKLNPIHTFIQDLKRKWGIISKAEIINDTEIENASASIAKKEQILNEVKGLFTKTEEYFVKIKESEIKEREHGLYKKEIKESQGELKEWAYQAKARTVVENEIDLIKEEIRRFIAEEIRPLTNIINTLYLRAQGNRFINSIEARPSKEGFLEWVAELNDEGESFDKMRSLSQGQRQDLALSIFLARARSLGGTFFLDEPLAHLDDLNRVALLDTLRIIVSERRATNPLRLVLTTASNNLLRHLREKFSLVEDGNGNPALRIYKMSGNPKVGLDVEPPELVHSPNRLLINNSVRP
ncbi:AAA family ATPase [Zhongshania borealis]|uniref:Rad50/SbcC-type AAA domain-containing protein n=1 Tax=Zhongshania borealis TaxID=889488 RepID=A0ABP7X289_9GAMM